MKVQFKQNDMKVIIQILELGDYVLLAVLQKSRICNQPYYANVANIYNVPLAFVVVIIALNTKVRSTKLSESLVDMILA